MTKVRAAALGRKHLKFISDLEITVVGGGKTKDHGRVLVNPADLDAARRSFDPTKLDVALEVTGDSFLVGSVFASAFQGIVGAGLVAGKGFGGAGRELMDRALPTTNTLALLLKNQADINRQHIAALGGSGSAKGTALRSGPKGSSSGSDGGSGSKGSISGSDGGSGSDGSEAADSMFPWSDW